MTNSIKANVQKSLSITSDISGKKQEELTTTNHKNIDKGNVIVTKLPTQKYVAAFYTWGRNINLSNIYNKKVEILNKSHFDKFKENILFIYALLMDNEEIESETNFLLNERINLKNSQQIDKILQFDKVYVLSEKFLLEINMDNTSQISRYELSNINLNEISNKAFYNVFGYTKNNIPLLEN